MCVLQQESEFSNYLLLATEALIVQQRAAPPLGRAGCCLEGSRSPLKSVKMEIVFSPLTSASVTYFKTRAVHRSNKTGPTPISCVRDIHNLG